MSEQIQPPSRSELAYEIYYRELLPGVSGGVLIDCQTGETFDFQSLPQLLELLSEFAATLEGPSRDSGQAS